MNKYLIEEFCDRYEGIVIPTSNSKKECQEYQNLLDSLYDECNKHLDDDPETFSTSNPYW